MTRTYAVEVEGVHRELPLAEVAPGTRIAVFNLLGDTEIVKASARGLAGRLSALEFDVVVTAEPKSLPLVYELASLLERPWVVLRKDYKRYMGDALAAEAVSITTRRPQRFFLDQKDRDELRGRRAVLVDDVVSTGSTMEAMQEIVERAGGTVVAQAAVFTEGDAERWSDVIALGHLPVFTDAPTLPAA